MFSIVLWKLRVVLQKSEQDWFNGNITVLKLILIYEIFKGPVCKIYGDLLAEMEYNIIHTNDYFIQYPNIYYLDYYYY